MATPTAQAQSAPANALTIDVEDWIQSVFDVDAPLTDCFIRNTHLLLEILSSCQVKATFFVLGLAAQKAPSLVKEIASLGHEIQSHGYGHRLVFNQTPRELREDVCRSKALLESLIGEPVTGYRAPAFSITRRTLWALDVLADAGFRYDSSIFPVRMRRYGVRGAPTIPHRLQTPGGSTLLEIPVCTLRLGPLTLPAGGGGYLRTAPYWYTRSAIHRTNRSGHPASIYLHPYELAPRELHELACQVPLRTRLHQSLGRSSVAAKLGRLLREFSFGTINDVLSRTAEMPSVSAEVNFCQGVAAALPFPA